MMLFTTLDLMPLILLIPVTLIFGFLPYLNSQVYIALIKYRAPEQSTVWLVTYLSLFKTSE